MNMSIRQHINLTIFGTAEDVFLEHIRATKMLFVKKQSDVVIVTRDLHVGKFHTAWVTVEIKMIHVEFILMRRLWATREVLKQHLITTILAIHFLSVVHDFSLVVS
jgi:hypothetical protein